ncbi:MAG: hypothetical protein GC153_08905 [Alphaproteobacteria bacterium]|nr:hypothetical protein [Alphaproteobacteria bacterium]
MSGFHPDQILILVGVAIVAFLLGRAARGVSAEDRAERDRLDNEAVEAALAGLSPDVRMQIDRLLSERKKIEAIKVFREATGLGLKQSKDAVERRALSLGA